MLLDIVKLGRRDDLYKKLEDGDYILLFFNKDFKRLEIFLDELISFLSEESITELELKRFLKNIVLDYLINYFNQDWAEYFANIKLENDESFSNFIMRFFTNLFV